MQETAVLKLRNDSVDCDSSFVVRCRPVLRVLCVFPIFPYCMLMLIVIFILILLILYCVILILILHCTTTYYYVLFHWRCTYV